jgi:hypothetical protein
MIANMGLKKHAHIRWYDGVFYDCKFANKKHDGMIACFMMANVGFKKHAITR